MRRAFRLGILMCLGVSIVLAFVALATKHPAGLFPKAYAQNGCTLETLRGSYGFAGDGFVTSEPVPANISAFTPVATVGVDTFDGAGNVSGTITVSFGGLIDSSPLSGTYSVNADCTGSATVTQTNSGGVIHLNFVIIDHGTQLRNLDTDTGTVSFATAVRE